MRVLLIEDDGILAQGVARILNLKGYAVDKVALGEDGIDLARHYEYDLIVLDLSLPDMGGLDVMRALHLAKIDTPVMVLSACVELASKVGALTAGADDYMVKPFQREELLARVQAIVRRTQGHAQSAIRTGAINVDLACKRVDVNGSPVHLTEKEYQILELLSLRKGSALSKEVFLNHLYGGEDEPALKIIDVFVCKLRRKLMLANQGAHHIETLWGRGYMLRDPPSVRRAA